MVGYVTSEVCGTKEDCLLFLEREEGIFNRMHGKYEHPTRVFEEVADSADIAKYLLNHNECDIIAFRTDGYDGGYLHSFNRDMFYDCKISYDIPPVLWMVRFRSPSYEA